MIQPHLTQTEAHEMYIIVVEPNCHGNESCDTPQPMALVKMHSKCRWIMKVHTEKVAHKFSRTSI